MNEQAKDQTDAQTEDQKILREAVRVVKEEVIPASETGLTDSYGTCPSLTYELEKAGTPEEAIILLLKAYRIFCFARGGAQGFLDIDHDLWEALPNTEKRKIRVQRMEKFCFLLEQWAQDPEGYQNLRKLVDEWEERQEPPKEEGSFDSLAD